MVSYAILSYNAHADSVAIVKSCDRSMASIVCMRLVRHWLAKKVHGCEELLFRERILEASKFIVGSSFSGPGNEANH